MTPAATPLPSHPVYGAAMAHDRFSFGLRGIKLKGQAVEYVRAIVGDVAPYPNEVRTCKVWYCSSNSPTDDAAMFHNMRLKVPLNVYVVDRASRWEGEEEEERRKEGNRDVSYSYSIYSLCYYYSATLKVCFITVCFINTL